MHPRLQQETRTQLLITAVLTAALGSKPAMPSLIAPFPTPFGLEFWLDVDAAKQVQQTCILVQRAVKDDHYINPITIHHMCEHLVGLHQRFLDGRAKLTRRARGFTSRAAMLALLERTYDALEPLAA